MIVFLTSLSILLSITGAEMFNPFHSEMIPEISQIEDLESFFSAETLGRRVNEKGTKRIKHRMATYFPSKESDDTTSERDAPNADVLRKRAIENVKPSIEHFGRTEEAHDVIIVGAGWAGISAAAYLQSKNEDFNFKILEGRDYIGGRSYTNKKAFIHKNGSRYFDVDMGSMWLLYGAQNPLWDLAKNVSVQMAPYGYINTLASMKNHETIGVADFSYYSENFYDSAYLYYRWAKAYIVENDEGLKVSASESIDLINENTQYYTGNKTAVFEASLQEYLELMYGARTEQMSLWYGVQGEESHLGGYYAEDNADHLLEGGFSDMVEHLASSFNDKIQKNSKVTDIDCTGEIVKVSYEDRSGEEVVTKVARAKKIILTVPIGVLKRTAEEGGINFTPPIPKKQAGAIRRIGVGQMVKIFMFWKEEDVFWPGEFDDAEQYIARDALGDDLRITFYNPSYNKEEKLPYLFTFMLGKKVDKIAKLYANSDEALYTKKLKIQALQRLRMMFGDDIPLPRKVVATKWTQDEFAYGVYSYNKVGYREGDRAKLRNSFQNKVFLAGEGTSTHHYATVHGAYWSGIDAAKKVLV